MPLKLEPKTKQMQDGLYAKFTTSKGEILVNLEFQKHQNKLGNFVALAQGNLEMMSKNKDNLTMMD